MTIERKTIPLFLVITHAVYLGLIALSGFILLATAKLSGDKAVVDYISFAATLSSLILAILAIYIGLSGNSGVTGFVSRAEELTQQARAVQVNLAEFSTITSQTATELNKQATRLTFLVSQLESVTNLVTELDTKVQVGFESISKASKDTEGATNPIDALNFNKEHFISTISDHGLITLYSVARLYEIEKKFSRSLFINMVSPGDDNYVHGCLVIMASAFVIDFNQDTIEAATINYSMFNSSQINVEIDRRIRGQISLNSSITNNLLSDRKLKADEFIKFVQISSEFS